ncbi:MAG: extracellular solute-binding protein [Clostridiales bacterium]|nr:extracellular solute-binding protein [Clostridiales bacterium]
MRPAGTWLLMALLISALFLSGCSRREGEESDQERIQIRLVYSAGDMKWKSGIEEITEAFMEENEDIYIELYNMPEIRNRTYIDSLKVLAAQEEFYDIVELRETGTLVRAGLLSPIPEEISCLTATKTMYNGDCYGVPRFTTTLGIIYNKDIFKELGLKEPETYGEFLEICETVKQAGYRPLALGAADLWHMKFWGNYLFQNYIVSQNGRAQWTRERTEEMLTDFRALARNGYIPSVYQSLSDSQTAQEISSGRAAMVYTGPWMLPQIQNLNASADLGFFFLPGKDGTVYAMMDSNVEWGISAKTGQDEKKLEAVTRFLSYYYSEGVYEDVLELMNAESSVLREVQMPDTINQQIMEQAFEKEPVRTGKFLEDMTVSEGFVADYEEILLEALWGRRPVSSLADALIQRWEKP